MFISGIWGHFEQLLFVVEANFSLLKARVKFVPFNTNDSIIFYTGLHEYMYMHFVLEYNFGNLFLALSLFPELSYYL